MEADTFPLIWGDAAVNTSILYCLNTTVEKLYHLKLVFWTCDLLLSKRANFFSLSWQDSFKIVELNTGEHGQQKLDFSYLYYSGKF